MALCLTERIEQITRAVTGRDQGLFAADCGDRADDLRATVTGKRVLVVGGAGSIGAATVCELACRGPAQLAVLDPNENNLAELVRTLRSDPATAGLPLILEPLPYGHPLTAAWLAAQEPYDVVLSFAALKHVRSGRDRYSAMRMLAVNLLEADRFLTACRRHAHGADGVFFVSTDKAADPVNLMGASKRLMEQLLWSHASAGAPAGLIDGGEAAPLPRVTTARFANVAFSDGSLPWSFLQRIEKRQPLALPGDVKRFLVSPQEAGQLCLLASRLVPHRHVFIPRLDAERDAVGFDAIAAATLRSYDLEPVWYEDEHAARSAVADEFAHGRYPVLVTRADTDGEKPMERFLAAGERVVAVSMAAGDGIPAPDDVAIAPLADFLRHLAVIDGGDVPPPSRDELVAMMTALIPGFHHLGTGRNLDGRM